MESHKKIGRTAIKADVREGDRRDALWFGISHNSKHGLRFTTKDKQRAIERILRDEEWSGLSDNQIAKVVGVDHKTVGAARMRLVGAAGTARQAPRALPVPTPALVEHEARTNGLSARAVNKWWIALSGGGP